MRLFVFLGHPCCWNIAPSSGGNFLCFDVREGGGVQSELALMMEFSFLMIECTTYSVFYRGIPNFGF